MISKLEEMFNLLGNLPRKNLVVAYAHDAHTIGAVAEAVEKRLVNGILVGDEQEIQKICKREGWQSSRFKIVHVPDEMAAANRAVSLVHEGVGNLIMKGTVSTDKYMRAILNKETGLMSPGALLTHVSVLEPVNYHKLLIVGDVAIIPAPGLKEKQIILNHLIHTAKTLGVKKPKVAVIAATEQVLQGMEACIDAAVLSKMADRGQIKGAIVEGPIALDVALNKESAEIKNIRSDVAGDADCLLFPNIESGNVFYKCHTKLLNGAVAAIVVGAKVPAILSSRGDTVQTKLYSIALGALTAIH